MFQILFLDYFSLFFLACIVTDQVCWITFVLQLDREGVKGWEDSERRGEGAIILNVSVKGRRLFEGGD